MPAQHRVLGRERVRHHDLGPGLRGQGGRESRFVASSGQLSLASSCGDTRACVTTSLSPAPARVARMSVADQQRRRPVGRHQRVRQVRRRRLVAADPGDFLGHVRLDGEVAAPRRHDGHERLLGSGVDDEEAWAPPATWMRAPDGAGSVSTPTRRSRSRCSLDRDLGAEQPAHAGRPEGQARRCRLGRGRVDATSRAARRRPRPASAGQPDRRRSGRAGTPGPSRSGGSPRSAARSDGPCGGC